MSQKTLALSLLIVVLSIVGIADAGYITYEEIQGVVPPCGPGFDCGAVLNSPYAHIGPVPLSALGLLYYTTILVLGFLHVSEVQIGKIFGKNTLFSQLTTLDELVLLSTAGLLFSGYLVFLMAVIIGAWCKFCLISAGTSTLLFVVVQSILWQEKNSSFFLKQLFFAVVAWMYQHILKPIFFLFDAETVHETMIRFGSLLGSTALTRWALRTKFSFTHQAAETQLFGITFPNPIGLSAGFDYNGDLTQILPAVGFGWHTIGTVTLQPYAGNPQPRLGRFPNSQALLVNKGLKSIGTPALIAKLSKLPLHIPTAISIASTNTHFDSLKDQLLDIVTSFYLFERSRVQHKLYELNISCPNTFGGEPFTTPERLEILLNCMDALKLTKPLLVKMPIDQPEEETKALLKVIARHTVHAVIFGNLTKDKHNPAVTPEDAAEWGRRKGNLSGRPTFERSNDCIAIAHKVLPSHIHIIGTGGIFTPEDIAIKNANGAELYQLITGMIFKGPQLLGQLTAAIAAERLKKTT